MATTSKHFKCIYHRDQIMMRNFSFFLILILSLTPCWAQQNKLIKCLAQEEAYFHKIKQVDAFSKLNQSFINFLTEYKYAIDKNATQKICRSENNTFISTKLLRYMLLRNNKQDSPHRKQALKLFFNFITDLQAVPKAPSCLEKNISELSALMKNFLHLEENLHINQVLNNKRVVKSIFRQLRKYKEIFAKCDK